MKRAIVTGSTKGIGKAIGKKLLAEGYFVTFNYAKDEYGKECLLEELQRDYQNRPIYEIIKNDFSSEEDMDQFVSTIMKSNETPQILVLNAGITDRTKFNDMTMAQWNEVLYTNLTVPTFLIQKIGRQMEMGSILCIGSILGEYAHSLSVPYGVTKAGLHFLSESLVKEFCDRMITINAIMTGFTDTDWQKKKPEEVRQRITDKIALKRFAEPEEIASLAYELLTNRYMTGSVVRIDGGYCYC